MFDANLTQAQRSAVAGLLPDLTPCLALNAKHLDGQQRLLRRGGGGCRIGEKWSKDLRLLGVSPYPLTSAEERT